MNTTSKKTQFSYLDEDDMVSNSATKVPTQQSVKAYVDTTAEGLHVLEAVNAATTGNITLSNQQTIDGVGVVAGDRVLVKDQSTSSKNGIYTCVNGGSWTRTSDFSSSPDVKLSDFVFCSAGTVNNGHGFVMTGSTNFTTTGYAADGTTPAGTVETHDIVFTQFSGVSSTVPVSKGGTGQISYTNGQLLIGNTSGNTLAKGTITGDDGITVTNGGGTIEIDLDLKSNGGAVIESNELAIDLGASSITGTLAVGDGGTGLTSLALTGSVAATRILVTNGSVMGFRKAADVCFLKGTKITLPDKSQKNIEDLCLGELVLTYQIDNLSNLKKDKKHDIMNWSEKSMEGGFNQSKIRNMWVNPVDRYLVINDKLRVTNLHIIHVKRGNEYKFLPAEKAQIGDLLFTDKDEYEPIQTIEQVNDRTEVYNIGLQKHRTYFAENYLVHHLCETCSGLSGRI
jgi:hypothetical protein